jgi:hypothetical protein
MADSSSMETTSFENVAGTMTFLVAASAGIVDSVLFVPLVAVGAVLLFLLCIGVAAVCWVRRSMRSLEIKRKPALYLIAPILIVHVVKGEQQKMEGVYAQVPELFNADGTLMLPRAPYGTGHLQAQGSANINDIGSFDSVRVSSEQQHTLNVAAPGVALGVAAPPPGRVASGNVRAPYDSVSVPGVMGATSSAVGSMHPVRGPDAQAPVAGNDVQGVVRSGAAIPPATIRNEDTTLESMVL